MTTFDADYLLVEQAARTWIARLSEALTKAGIDERSVNAKRDIRLLAFRLSETIAGEMNIPSIQPDIYRIFKVAMGLER